MDSLFIDIVSEEHLPGNNYIVVLQRTIDSAMLKGSFTFLLLRSELCMSKRGKKAPYSLRITVCILPTDYLFPVLQSNEKLGGLTFTSSALQKKHHDFNGNQMSDHYVNGIMRHRTNVETLNALGQTHQNGNWQQCTGTLGFLHTQILLQTFPAAANAGSAPLEVAVEGV